MKTTGHVLCAIAFLLLLVILWSATCGCQQRKVTPPPAAGQPDVSHLPGLGTDSVPQPVQHYEKAVGAGPEISGIKPGWFRPVPCRIDVDQLRAQWKLEREQEKAEEDAKARAMFRWIGFPLLCLGAIALVIGGYFSVKGVDLGADLLLGGAIAAAVGAVLVLYPALIGYASAAAVAGAILWAVWQRWGKARAAESFEQTVEGLDVARKALGDADWKNKVAPFMRGAQNDRTVAWVKRIQSIKARVSK